MIEIGTLEIVLIVYAIISEYLGMDSAVKPNGVAQMLGGWVRDIAGRVKDN